MQTPGIDWTSAIVMLTAGIVAGAIFIYVTVRSRGAAAAESIDRTLERRDLEAKADALIQQLRELEDTAGKIDPHDLARQRYELELQAARVWQQVDGAAKTTRRVPAATVAPGGVSSDEEAAPDVAAPGFLAQYPAVRGFLWGMLSLGILVGLFFFVSRSASQRPEGGSATGGTESGPMAGGAQQAAANDPELQQARAAVATNPSSDDARLELARLSLVNQDLMEALTQTETILQRSPKNAKALTYQSFVRLAMGQADNALQMLKQATGYEPDLIDAWIQMSMVYTQMERDRDAAEAMNKAIQLRPDQKVQLEGLLAQWKQARDEAASVQQDTTPAVAPAPADDSTAVSGTVELDASVTNLPANATLYIMAREAGVAAGPPVAVERIVPGKFPLSFTVGASNSMMGQGLPPRARIEARLDFDGDAMTRETTDPIAVLDPVPAGTKGVKLVLKRP